MKAININGVDYTVLNANEDARRPQPHIMVTLSGDIPDGKQLGLLKEYLKQNGVEPINGATTYWCINKVLKLGMNNDAEVKSKKNEHEYLPITEENIEGQHRLVEASSNYGKEGLIIHDAIPPFVASEVLNREADLIILNEFVLTAGWHCFKSLVEVEYELFASPYVSGQNGILIGLRKKVNGLDYNSIKIIADMNTEYERPNFLQVDFNYMNSHYSVIGVRNRVGFDKKSEGVTTQLQAIYQHLLSLNPKSKIICAGDYNAFPRVLWKTTEIEGTMSDTLETQGFDICCPAYDGVSDSYIRRNGDYIKWSFVHEDGAKSLLDHLIYLGARIEKADYDWKFVTRENGYIKEGKNINAEDNKEFLIGYPDHAMLIVELI
ncbi:MAG: hypothetical protein WBI07_07185 [Mobilitalea sp.]